MIRFMLTEVPSTRSLPEHALEPVIDDLLPWADPYIVKLAQALEREAREQLQSALLDEEETREDDFDAAYSNLVASRISGAGGRFASEARPGWTGSDWLNQ